MHQYLLLTGRITYSLAKNGLLSELTGSELKTLLGVVRHLNIGTGKATCSVKTLARVVGAAESTVLKALKSLVGQQLLAHDGETGFELGEVLVGYLTEHEAKVSKATRKSHMRTRDVVVSSRDSIPEGENLREKFERSETPSAAQPPRDRAPELSADLPAALVTAASRKGTQASDLLALVALWGREKVEAAVEAMTAQYPDDNQVKSSFGALVRRACQFGWTVTKAVEAKARETVQRAVEAARPSPEARWAVSASGDRLKVLEHRVNSVVVEFMDQFNKLQETVIPEQMYPQYRWAS